jgi:hypothetical protein
MVALAPRQGLWSRGNVRVCRLAICMTQTEPQTLPAWRERESARSGVERTLIEQTAALLIRRKPLNAEDAVRCANAVGRLLHAVDWKDYLAGRSPAPAGWPFGRQDAPRGFWREWRGSLETISGQHRMSDPVNGVHARHLGPPWAGPCGCCCRPQHPRNRPPGRRSAASHRPVGGESR